MKITFIKNIKFKRKKRLTYNIPDWADDVCVSRWDKNGIQVPWYIKYYKGSTRYTINIPSCKKVNTISLTPLYNKNRTGYSINRKIIIDIYL
jgi:hypothetical protein